MAFFMEKNYEFNNGYYRIAYCDTCESGYRALYKTNYNEGH